MICKILILLLITTPAFGFHKDFKTVNDRVPLEFSHLFNSMKTSLKTPSEQIKLVGLAKELDENLGSLKTEHIFFLMKSEVIKNVLGYRFTKVRQFDITLLLLKRLDDELEKKEKFLSPFSLWIWRSIMAELNHRKDLGLISNKSFQAGSFEGSKKIEAQRFARYLNYLIPWIDRMDGLSAPEFNDLTKQVSWIILRRLNERSLLFKRFATQALGDTKVTIFNIPQKLLELHPEEIKRMQSNEAPTLDLKEESEKEKNEARKQIQDVTPTDMSPLSDEISQELDKNTP